MSVQPARRPQAETPATENETRDDDDDFDPWARPQPTPPATQEAQQSASGTQVTQVTPAVTQVKNEVVEPKRPPPPCPVGDQATQVETPAPQAPPPAPTAVTQTPTETPAEPPVVRYVDPLSAEGIEYTKFTNWFDFRNPNEPLTTRRTLRGSQFLDVEPRDTGLDVHGQQIKIYNVRIYQIGNQYFTVAPGNEDFFAIEPSAVREIGIPVFIPPPPDTPYPNTQGSSSSQPPMPVKPELEEEVVFTLNEVPQEVTATQEEQTTATQHGPPQATPDILQAAIQTQVPGGSDSSDLAGMD
jgi:hypothetical protein